MTKKMILFDIDGTLLDQDKNLPVSAKEAVKLVKEAGHEVAIATGRPPYFFNELREELEIDSFVCLNGQYVEIENKVIYKNPIDKELLKNLSSYSASHEHPLVFMGLETLKVSIEAHPKVEKSLATLKLKDLNLQTDANFFKDNEIYQTLLFCKEDEENFYRDRIQTLNFIRWHEYSMDVLPQGGSKAAGIEKFIEKKVIQKIKYMHLEIT